MLIVLRFCAHLLLMLYSTVCSPLSLRYRAIETTVRLLSLWLLFVVVSVVVVAVVVVAVVVVSF